MTDRLAGSGADAPAGQVAGRVGDPRRPRPDVETGPLHPSRGGGEPIDTLDDDEAGLYALVDQLRRIRALTTGGVFETDLGPLTARLREVADRLEDASASPERRQAVAWSTGDYVANCPVVGRSNALAPPVEFEILEDGTLRGEVTLGLEYQGPPACVHGGIVSLLFDVVLGRANFHAGATGMTVYLDVDYRSPTPVLEPIVVTGRQVRVDGRKIWSQGAIHADGRLCATAEGMFVEPGGLLLENRRRLAGG
ncbi:PaaI family thioesterase [Dietzia sp. PP-33]|mgnify:CR=1 FL=1|jgi:acyl-coenzyme A thioesterase PaaI-like protein|uniref:PaaI family thioesterase n=1 Tax=Dietzia sp. PP-33 TaxID=2957500 RepID=UPI0029ADA638|nr:PaaI family thioesterase [Dietzia sp. PP-33]MDX2357598.1 PaaI family thioesterase [Dietzia sp. PP-33]